ncbi:MAG: NADH-quinone oxidoreductase subunit NuoN [Kordiimonadaceae bacterium]|nr:NADH-quinone oxidoreductase subunit NuoN [Kordiimonadaceae bacterium]MBT6037484.1 NADH-quinone oxidoreductase subunit NuoN [Kordiimonadaceae bacterium]MBT6329420.1 NADH-quinone oxidoreductase subunit NuoN [Kordiimonadaceae bacterium]MBT7582652.1 NADH-quinone oxidoreductase subunit NuoN [Kordiimonadaceae bacterium]
MTEIFPNLEIAYGEIFLSIGALTLLMVGVFKKDSVNLVSWLAVGFMGVALALTVMYGAGQHYTFSNLFVADGFTQFMKILVLVAAALAVIMSREFFKLEGDDRFEFPVLLVLATVGMMVMVSANDLMSLYMGIELQSLSLYVLAAFKRDSERSTEAGLKYFVLGALSSGILLYGCSLIYGFIGSTNFSSIATAVSNFGEGEMPLGAIVGLVFVLSGLAFKISAVPFHMWTPDVYEGSQTPVTAFFAVAPKVAALALLARTLYVPFGEMSGSWAQVVIFMSVASMILGSFAAIMQTNIKRLMAYSSIGHVGFALLGIIAGTTDGLRGLMIYMTIYLVMNIGMFVCIMSMRRKEDGMVEDISELSGLGQNHPLMAAFISIFMFSLAGVPPLAGFFAKWYVIIPIVKQGYFTLATVAVLASVVGAYYYIRIVKVMYFDDPVEEFQQQKSFPMKIIVTVSAILIIAFIMPQISSPVLEGASIAAQGLVQH